MSVRTPPANAPRHTCGRCEGWRRAESGGRGSPRRSHPLSPVTEWKANCRQQQENGGPPEASEAPIVATERHSTPLDATRRHSSPLVATRRYSSPLVATRRTSTHLDAPRRNSTQLDATRRNSTQLDADAAPSRLGVRLPSHDWPSPGVFTVSERNLAETGARDAVGRGGKMTRNSAPPSDPVLTSIVASCCRATHAAIASPSPLPSGARCRASLPRNDRSKICRLSSAAIPTPESSTSRTARQSRS